MKFWRFSSEYGVSGCEQISAETLESFRQARLHERTAAVLVALSPVPQFFPENIDISKVELISASDAQNSSVFQNFASRINVSGSRLKLFLSYLSCARL